MTVYLVGVSGKLGRCMVQQALDRGYEVVGVCCSRHVPRRPGGGERAGVRQQHAVGHGAGATARRVRGGTCPCRVLPVEVPTGHCQRLGLCRSVCGPALVFFALAERRIVGGLTGAEGPMSTFVHHGAKLAEDSEVAVLPPPCSRPRLAGHNLQGPGAARGAGLSR